MKLIIIFFCFFTLFLYGQEDIPIMDMDNTKYNISLEKFYQTRSVTRTISPQVLETAIDPESYLVGPGDKFQINILSELQLNYNVTVNPEGSISIPNVGEVFVNDINLKSAKEKIKSYISRYYIKSKSIIHLTSLRKFRVYFTGEVSKPGTYFAQASDRLSDIIEVSSTTEEPGLTEWADNTKIEIYHIDGSKSLVDVSKFYRNGDKTQNPNLKNGDLIFVPPIDLADSFVIIEGNVGFQGIYSLKKNESIYDFLMRISLLNRSTNIENIVLYRDGNQKTYNLIKNYNDVNKIKLMNKDRLKISTYYSAVYVRGEVANPGEFKYLANYKAKDYIGQAGVLDTATDDDEIIIIREKSGNVLKGGDVIVEKGDTIIVPKRSREILKDYMTIIMPIISIIITTIALLLN